MPVDTKLGVKRRCLACDAPFYDMNRSPITCVKCGSLFLVVEYPRAPPRYRQQHQSLFKRSWPAPAEAEPASSGQKEGEES